MRSEWRATSFRLPWRSRVAAAPVVAAAQTPQELVWAGDSEGGAPYVEADPSRPDRVIGFEVEIADLLARGLGRTPRFINITFTTSPVDRQGRRGPRPQRHRRHARQPRRAGHDGSVLQVPRGLERPRRPIRSATARSPTCGAAASARSAARSPTKSCSAPPASTACSRCPSRTTRIRIPISSWGASTPCCLTTSSRNAC